MEVGSWLAANDLGLLADALRRSLPALDAGRAALSNDDDRPEIAPAWMRSTAALGPDVLVKYAWSAEAAARLAREAAATVALRALRPALRLPEVVGVSADPVLLATRREQGEWLVYPDAGALEGERLARTAGDLAGFLGVLHDPALVEEVRAGGVDLPPPAPQATTDAIRAGLGPFVDEARMRLVRRWCDWTDAVLAGPVPTDVVLHGDFAGHNLLWDRTSGAVGLFYDLEEVSCGDPAYDFRYLPAQAPTLAFLHATMAAYEAERGPVDLRRVMAWHVRTSLGDALWRSQAGVALPFDGDVPGWVDELERRFAAAGIDAS